MTVELLLADSHAKLRAALELVFASAAGYAPAAIIDEAVPEFRRLDAASTARLR